MFKLSIVELCKALADAVVLARELSECGSEGPLPAILRFETEMIARSSSKVLASRAAASFLHSELAISEGDKTRAAMAAGAEEKQRATATP